MEQVDGVRTRPTVRKGPGGEFVLTALIQSITNHDYPECQTYTDKHLFRCDHTGNIKLRDLLKLLLNLRRYQQKGEELTQRKMGLKWKFKYAVM